MGQIHGLALGQQHKAGFGQNELLTAAVDGVLDGNGLWTRASDPWRWPSLLLVEVCKFNKD